MSSSESCPDGWIQKPGKKQRNCYRKFTLAPEERNWNIAEHKCREEKVQHQHHFQMFNI